MCGGHNEQTKTLLSATSKGIKDLLKFMPVILV